MKLEPGTQVELDVAVGQPRLAEVRWVNDLKVGVAFSEEFDMKSLVAVQGKSEASGMLMPAYLAGGGTDETGANRA
jgi:hypothetical protein